MCVLSEVSGPPFIASKGRFPGDIFHRLKHNRLWEASWTVHVEAQIEGAQVRVGRPSRSADLALAPLGVCFLQVADSWVQMPGVRDSAQSKSVCLCLWAS